MRFVPCWLFWKHQRWTAETKRYFFTVDQVSQTERIWRWWWWWWWCMFMTFHIARRAAYQTQRVWLSSSTQRLITQLAHHIRQPQSTRVSKNCALKHHGRRASVSLIVVVFSSPSSQVRGGHGLPTDVARPVYY